MVLAFVLVLNIASYITFAQNAQDNDILKTVGISVTVTIEGDDAPPEDFIFILTKLDENGNEISGKSYSYETVFSLGDSSLSFDNVALREGDNFFKLEEDTSNVPLGWSYDKSVYVVNAKLDDNGKLTLGHGSDAVAFVHSVHATNTEQKVTVVDGLGGIGADGGNIHEEGLNLGLQCYFHGDGSSGSMHYRYVMKDNETVIGTAYCIDYLNLITDNQEYIPSTDWNDFYERFGENADTILWLIRNGFYSKLHGENPGDPFGVANTDNNLQDVQDLTGMRGDQSGSGSDGILSEEEAYSATQLAIWHFTNSVEWVIRPGNSSEGLDLDHERLISWEYKDVYDAHIKLIEAASSAAPDAGESISQVSAKVNFDFTGADVVDVDDKVRYGPVAFDLELENLSGEAKVDLSSDEGRITDRSGNNFYVELENIPAPHSDLATANVEIITGDDAIEDTYFLKSVTGKWEDAQSLLGIGFAHLKVEAEASLVGGTRPHGKGPVDQLAEFVNSYREPPEPPSPPEPPGPPDPLTENPPSSPPSDDDDNDDPPDPDNPPRFDLRISKTVTGSADDDDLQKLFRFQIVYAGFTSALYDTGPIPLAAVLTPDTILVEGSGISKDRIQLDSQGKPTILLLRHDETATVKRLYAGTYRIVELDSDGYDTTYVIGSEEESTVTDTGSTQSFSLRENLSVIFKNTAIEIAGHDNPQTGGDAYNPQTGSGNIMAIWFVVPLLCVCRMIGLLLRRLYF
jgi:TQXA domain-containing protein